MSSITDYIRWYADFTFYDKPFNEADNVVLCMLTYYGFDLKESSRPTSVRRAVTGDRQDDPFLNAVCSSRRFGSLLISDFLEIFSRDTCIQFAAMKFHLYDNVYYIAFRGTDNSLVGWKEDFVMSLKRSSRTMRSISSADTARAAIWRCTARVMSALKS